ncbi:DUF6167 family protein [Streptomyces sparsus]
MFRRAFWFSAGAATGVWATTKVNRKLRSLTPESLAARAAEKAVDAGHRLKEFATDVRSGMVQREDELNDALGLHASPDDPALGRSARGAALPRATAADPRNELGPIHRTTRNEDH